ncbi:T9SS type A sorting domain-containing protein, partial [Flaviramulus multivorans]
TATQCTNPGGYSTTAPTIDDCDDTDANINPNTVWYADTDSDGYGDNASSLTQCTQPLGYVLDNTDCDDTNNAVNPGVAEIPGNGIDDDCNAGTPDGSLEVDEFNINNVLVSPNPFNNIINIKLPSSLNNSDFDIRIFDLNGRLVLDKQYSSINNSIHVTGLDKLEQAPYLFKITNKETGASVIKRLIKF